MKLKSYIIMLAAAAGTGIFSACEDMLEPTSEYVLYDDGSHLTTPADTANSLVGLFYKLQAIGDRTNLLGEIRGDLVNLRSNASTDLQDLYNFNVGDDNKYNNPRDYYAIINNCNYYVTHADTNAYDNRGDFIFEREMAQVKAIRAWTYLQLALNYGSVPFYDQALLTEQDANAIDLAASRRDITGICDYFINDLQSCVGTEWPRMHLVGSVLMANCYFPVDMVLGDLYLWRASLTGSVADYRSAARCYYRWILDTRFVERVGNTNFTKPLYAPDEYSASWVIDGASAGLSDSYTWMFNVATNTYGQETFTMIPMDSAASQGYYSELPRLYNSQFGTNDNGAAYVDTSNGEYCITPSDYLQEISRAQSYCLLNSEGDRVFLDMDEEDDYDPLLEGDLRLYMLWRTGSYNTTIGGEPGTATYQGLTKNNQRAIPIYRQTDVWLRLAEALNGAGLPRMAYAILATGLSSEVVEDSIKPYCTDADLAFVEELNGMGTGNSFSNFIARPGVRGQNDVSYVIGIHSRGSGYAELNPDYAYPMVDSIAADGVTHINGYTGQDTLEWAQLHLEEEKLRVDSMLLTEMALETCFEGKRFYDLMRFAKRHHDNAWLADPVSKRKGAENQDQGLHNLLMTEDNWYLNWRGQIGR